MKNLKPQIALIFICIISCFSAAAQNNRGTGEAYFDSFEPTKAAPEAEFMWIGTEGEGLYKYDTKNNSYTSFNIFNSDIPTNYISDVKVDKNGSLWLATNLGLVFYDKKQWTLYSNIMATSIAVDLNNKIWVGTGKSIFSINNAEIKQYDKTNSVSSLDSVVRVVVDGNNKKWFSTSKGIVSFDEKSWATFGVATNINIPIAVDKLNNLWFVTGGNLLYKYDGKTTTYIPTPTSTGSPSGYYSKFSNDILTDDNNLYVITSNSVLLKYSNGNFQELRGPQYLFFLGVDNNKKLWLVSDYTEVQTYESSGFKNIIYPNNYMDLTISKSFAIDKNDQIWSLGLDKTLYFIESGILKSVTPPSNIDVRSFDGSLIIDSQNNKWFSTYGGIVKFDGKNWTLFPPKITGIASNVENICVDKNNTLWFGTNNGNFYSYDGKIWTNVGDKITKFPKYSFGAKKFLADNNDNIWMAGDNLLKYNTKTATLTVYDSFYLNSVVDMTLDKDGVVWAKDIFGLQRYFNGKWEQHFDGGDRAIGIDTKNNIWVPVSNLVNPRLNLAIFKGTSLLTNTFNNWNLYTDDIKFDSKNNLWYSFYDRGIQYSPSGLVKLVSGNEKVAVNSSSTNKVINPDENTDFLIKITGNNLSLQWQVNKGSVWEDLKTGKNTEFTVSGEKTNLLALSKCSITANNYKFRCKVSDDDTKEVIYSNPMNLSIFSVFTITNQLSNKDIFENEAISYNVTATGRNNISYQWQVKRSTKFENLTTNDKEFTVKGEKTADLTLTAVKLIANNFTIRCLVNALPDTLTTNSSKITVKEIFVITQSPQNSSIVEGATTSFEITTSKDSLTYLWQYKDSNNWIKLPSSSNNYTVDGIDTKKITLKKVNFLTNGLIVRCIVNNKYKYQLTSDEAILTVNKILSNEIFDNFNIFPNPIIGSYLNVSNINNLKSFTILDSQGIEVMSGEVNSNQLNISNLKNGTYILHLRDKKGDYYFKKLTIFR